MAFKDTVFLVGYMEDGSHWFVVGDALWVWTLYDASQFIRHNNLFLFYNFVVLDDVQYHVRSHYRQTADFLVTEEAVGYFDESLLAQTLAGKVVADSDALGCFLKFQQINYGKQLVGRNMVDNSAVLDGGHL